MQYLQILLLGTALFIHKESFNFAGTCETEKVNLVSELVSKERKGSFFNRNNRKLRRIEKILHNDEVILEAVSKFLCSGDACDVILFRRFLIKENYIAEFRFQNGKKVGEIVKYNFCGEKLATEKLPSESILTRFLEENQGN